MAPKIKLLTPEQVREHIAKLVSAHLAPSVGRDGYDDPAVADEMVQLWADDLKATLQRDVYAMRGLRKEWKDLSFTERVSPLRTMISERAAEHAARIRKLVEKTFREDLHDALEDMVRGYSWEHIQQIVRGEARSLAARIFLEATGVEADVAPEVHDDV